MKLEQHRHQHEAGTTSSTTRGWNKNIINIMRMEHYHHHHVETE
jgi:hypothetical protein